MKVEGNHEKSHRWDGIQHFGGQRGIPKAFVLLAFPMLLQTGEKRYSIPLQTGDFSENHLNIIEVMRFSLNSPHFGHFRGFCDFVTSGSPGGARGGPEWGPIWAPPGNPRNPFWARNHYRQQ